jgi:hypothetical protein
MELLAIRLSEQTTLAKSLVMAHRQSGKHVIGQMRGGLGHAPCVARRAYAAPFARKGDEEVVTSLVAVGAGKAVG